MAGLFHIVSYPTEETDWSDMERLGPGEIAVTLPPGSNLDVYSPVSGKVTAVALISLSQWQAFKKAFSWLPGSKNVAPETYVVVDILEDGTSRTHRLSPLLKEAMHVRAGESVFPGQPIGVIPLEGDDYAPLVWKIQSGAKAIDPIGFLAEGGARGPAEARKLYADTLPRPAPVPVKPAPAPSRGAKIPVPATPELGPFPDPKPAPSRSGPAVPVPSGPILGPFPDPVPTPSAPGGGPFKLPSDAPAPAPAVPFDLGPELGPPRASDASGGNLAALAALAGAGGLLAWALTRGKSRGKKR